MVARLPATDVSPTWSRRRFSYYTETPAGREYPRICRKIRYDSASIASDPSAGQDRDNDFRDGGSGVAEVLLDVSDLAEGSDYLELGVTVVSPDEDLLAWSVDTDGDEVYRLRFRDLRTGEDLPDEVPRTYYGAAWSADSRWFFYTVHDAAYRGYQVWRHRVGSDVADDVLVVEEPDERFEIWVRATRSGDWVVVTSESNTTAETWLVDAHDPEAPPRRAGGRRDGVRYRVDHRRRPGGDDLLVVVDDRVEQRLMVAPVPGPEGADHTTWVEARPEDPAVHLERADAFGGGVVLSVRTGGAHQLVLVRHDDLAGAGHRGDQRGGRRRGAARPHDGVRRRPGAGPGRVVAQPAGVERGGAGERRTPRRTTRGGAGLRPGGVRRGAARVPVGRRHARPGVGDAPPRHPARRHRAGGALRLRRLRLHVRARVGPRAAVAARPRRGVGARPRPGRQRGWPGVVPRRQARGQAAHLRRPHRGRRRPRGSGHGRPRPDRHPRAQRGRAAAGRGVQPAPRPLAGGRRGGPLRRRGDHDVRRGHAADDHRVGGVGRPPGPGGVRPDAGAGRRTTTCRRPEAGPTCWSPARCTTRG